MKYMETEYWLNGPLPNITPWLQPVAHTLLQSQREIYEIMENCNDDILWQMLAGIASPAFHLQHIAGVLDRLLTYAGDKQLTEKQLDYLSYEGRRNDSITVRTLLQALQKQIKLSIDFLHETKPKTLTETRHVGRKKIPSTQLGLLFHAAEHTMRHTGQLMVTVKIILNENKKRN